MYTDVLISTMVITTVIAWSFCSNALNICFMDGAAQAKDTRDNAIFEADSAIGECLARLVEVEYLSKTINRTFQR